MADESCAFPGDAGAASRTSGRWPDRETAEQLLSGAPLESGRPLDGVPGGPYGSGTAARLVGALDALRSLGTAQGGAALPGEDAAVAAFRLARDTAREAHVTAPSVPAGRQSGAYTAAVDLGSVRLSGATGTAGDSRPGAAAPRTGPGGGRRRGRRATAPRAGHARSPLRFGLVAAFACCTLGGVTVAAATTGMLPSPFGGHDPSPSVSVTDGVTPARPGLTTAPVPTGPTPGGSGTPSGGGRASGDPSASAGGSGSSQEWWTRMVSACQDYRGGRGDNLYRDTERELERAAHGAGHVQTFCAGLLADDSGGAPGPSGSASHDGTDPGSGDQGTPGGSGTTGTSGANGADGNGGDDGGNGDDQGDSGTSGSGNGSDSTGGNGTSSTGTGGGTYGTTTGGTTGGTDQGDDDGTDDSTAGSTAGATVGPVPDAAATVPPSSAGHVSGVPSDTASSSQATPGVTLSGATAQ